MRSGYNPTRRNRNIGTSAQGHGSDNRFTIPRICQEERTWWELISAYEFAEYTVFGCSVASITEKTHPGYIHACTIGDVLTILGSLPQRDVDGMNTIVFRQPTSKQRIMAPVWGRMAYSASIGRPAKRESRIGPANFLEAQSPSEILNMSESLDSEDLQEVERLVADGHRLEDNGKVLKFHSTPESIRNTQLYRTLIHEIGQWVDWLENVVRPAGGKLEDEEMLSENYFSRSKNEREAFAHRYAQNMGRLLRQRNLIPFSTTT